jgi:hypothetical protein
MATMYASTDAVIAVASKVEREWGSHGYSITDMQSPGFCGDVLAEVRASDGSTFYVGSTRYGNTVHADDFEVAVSLLAAKRRDERG